jgi:hypothetical protein
MNFETVLDDNGGKEIDIEVLRGGARVNVV